MLMGGFKADAESGSAVYKLANQSARVRSAPDSSARACPIESERWVSHPLQWSHVMFHLTSPRLEALAYDPHLSTPSPVPVPVRPHTFTFSLRPL